VLTKDLKYGIIYNIKEAIWTEILGNSLEIF
jgi:hypothetical protein